MTARLRTINDLASVARGRRLALGLSQAAVAARIGVSRKWIYEFEAGRPRAELGLALALLDALDLEWTVGPTAPAADAGGVDLDAILDAYRRP